MILKTNCWLKATKTLDFKMIFVLLVRRFFFEMMRIIPGISDSKLSTICTFYSELSEDAHMIFVLRCGGNVFSIHLSIWIIQWSSIAMNLELSSVNLFSSHQLNRFGFKTVVWKISASESLSPGPMQLSMPIQHSPLLYYKQLQIPLACHIMHQTQWYLKCLWYRHLKFLLLWVITAHMATGIHHIRSHTGIQRIFHSIHIPRIYRHHHPMDQCLRDPN